MDLSTFNGMVEYVCIRVHCYTLTAYYPIALFSLKVTKSRLGHICVGFHAFFLFFCSIDASA